jgi:hypothetical protein
VSGQSRAGISFPYSLGSSAEPAFVHHPAVAALDQNVGDPLVDFEVLRNGERVVLGGIFDQIGIAELLRVHQHPFGDCGRVVKGKARGSVWAARCRYQPSGGAILLTTHLLPFTETRPPGVGDRDPTHSRAQPKRLPRLSGRHVTN